VLRLSQRSKERLKTMSSCSKTTKERKEIKKELCSAQPKGFGQQQVSVGALGVHLSTSYILFLYLCASFPLYSAT
jgi:hypothetical protein